MKKTITLLMTIALTLALCCGAFAENYSVGVCQLMVHDSLDQATQGFVDALTEKMEEAGNTVDIDTQVAGDASLCTTVVNAFNAKRVDLIMANGTPALLAAANMTTEIPILGTSVTDYDGHLRRQHPRQCERHVGRRPLRGAGADDDRHAGPCRGRSGGRALLHQRVQLPDSV